MVALAVVFTGSSQHAEGHVLGAGVTSGSWATPAELAWLEKLGSWDTRLLRGLQSAARVETTPRLAQKLMRRDGRTVVLHSRALEPAGSCAADLTTKVGAPPTARLDRAFDTFRLACEHLQRFHGAITLAINHGQDSEIGTAQAEGKRAARRLLTADQMLPPGEVRSLPVIAGDVAPEPGRASLRSRCERARGQATRGPLLVRRRLATLDTRGVELHPREARGQHPWLRGDRRYSREPWPGCLRRARRSRVQASTADRRSGTAHGCRGGGHAQS